MGGVFDGSMICFEPVIREINFARFKDGEPPSVKVIKYPRTTAPRPAIEVEITITAGPSTGPNDECSHRVCPKVVTIAMA